MVNAENSVHGGQNPYTVSSTGSQGGLKQGGSENQGEGQVRSCILLISQSITGVVSDRFYPVTVCLSDLFTNSPTNSLTLTNLQGNLLINLIVSLFCTFQ